MPRSGKFSQTTVKYAICLYGSGSSHKGRDIIDSFLNAGGRGVLPSLWKSQHVHFARVTSVESLPQCSAQHGTKVVSLRYLKPLYLYPAIAVFPYSQYHLKRLNEELHERFRISRGRHSRPEESKGPQHFDDKIRLQIGPGFSGILP